MLTVPHMIAGAALGSLVGEIPSQNVFAFAVGWGSHYVLDAVPHWERLFGSKGSDFSTETPVSQWPKPFFYQAVGDVLLAVAVIAGILVWQGDLATFWQSPVFWGALGGFFPDLIDNLPFWNRIMGKIGWVQQERQFHKKYHVSDETQQRVPRYTGLLTQLIVMGVGLWILL